MKRCGRALPTTLPYFIFEMFTVTFLVIFAPRVVWLTNSLKLKVNALAWTLIKMLISYTSVGLSPYMFKTKSTINEWMNVPKLTISILGDLNLSQLLIIPRFRIVLNSDFVFYPASTMSSLAQYRTLLPAGTRYLVVGCLSPLLVDQTLTADMELSMYYFCTISNCWFFGSQPFYWLVNLERFMIEFSQNIMDILDSNSGLRKPRLTREVQSSWKWQEMLTAPSLNQLRKKKSKCHNFQKQMTYQTILLKLWK